MHNKGKSIGRSPTGRTSFSSMESVPSPDDNNSHHHHRKRSYSSFEQQGSFSGPGTTSSKPETNPSALKFSSLNSSNGGGDNASASFSPREQAVSEQQREGTIQGVMTNALGGRREDDERSPMWRRDSPHRFEQRRRAVFHEKNDSSSSSGMNAAAEVQRIFSWKRAPPESEQQQQRKRTTSQGHTMTNTPSTGRGGTKRRENDDEGPIRRDLPRQFEWRAVNRKKDNSSDSSSMNFLISVFLAGPEAALRPERNDDKEDVQSSSSLLSPKNDDGNALTNSSAIAFFVNPKLWKKADNPNTVGGTRLEERYSHSSLIPPLNKALHEQFLLRPVDLPDPRTKLPPTDASKFDFLQNWFQRPPNL